MFPSRDAIPADRIGTLGTHGACQSPIWRDAAVFVSFSLLQVSAASRKCVLIHHGACAGRRMFEIVKREHIRELGDSHRPTTSMASTSRYRMCSASMLSN